MQKQMCWLSSSSTGEEKILHLKEFPHQPWRPYTAFPQYATPDYRIPQGSMGWATFHKLRQAGWVLVSSSTATTTKPQEEVTSNPNRLA